MGEEYRPEDHSGEKADISPAEMARAKVMGGRYARKALRTVRLLGEMTGIDEGKYEDDNIVIEETPGESYYDGQDVSSVRVWAKKKVEGQEEPEKELVLEYGAGRVGFLRSLGRFNRGAWTESMDSLDDALERAEEAQELQKYVNASEPFLPVDYEGDRILSKKQILEAKLKGKKYCKATRDIAEQLGEYSSSFRSYEEDGLKFGYDYGDDSTPSCCWIKRKVGEGDKDYETVFSSYSWISDHVTGYKSGPWEEKVRELAEKARAVKEADKAQAAAEHMDKFRPQE